jgi:hypothetical protein
MSILIPNCRFDAGNIKTGVKNGESFDELYWNRSLNELDV